MVRQWLMHDDGFTIAQNQKTTLLWFSPNAESVPVQRVPVKIDCLDLSNSMKSACPDCTSMKVQIGFVTSRRWLNFQVVAWAGVLTSRNSLKLCGKAKCCLQTYPCIICWSFIPGLFTIKSWLVVACYCSSQFSLSQWKSFSSEAESCKLQVLVPIQRGHQVWSRSFMQPLHTHDHPRVHCWISNKHRHSEWTVCIQRWPATLSRHMHLFLWRISTICQPRQCRSNSNQETKIEHLLFTFSHVTQQWKLSFSHLKWWGRRAS